MNIKDKNIYLKTYGKGFETVEAYPETSSVLRSPLDETQKLYRIVEVEEVTVDVTINSMKPTYKKVKTLAPHCPKCGEQLRGNNSFMLPWECSCGMWKATGMYPWPGTYEIIPRIKV